MVLPFSQSLWTPIVFYEPDQPFIGFCMIIAGT